MSSHLIVAVGLVYLYIAMESFYVGNTGLSIVFFGYALANVGLWMGAK